MLQLARLNTIVPTNRIFRYWQEDNGGQINTDQQVNSENGKNARSIYTQDYNGYTSQGPSFSLIT